MRKRLCEILTITSLLFVLCHYAENHPYPGKTLSTSVNKEALKETSKEISQKTAKETLEASAKDSSKEMPEIVPEEGTTRLYQEVVESAKLDWHWVIEPGQVEDFHFLGSTYIAVKKENGKYGIMDAQGQWICAEEFDAIAPYREHLACASNGGIYYYLDEKGQCVTEGVFQEARSFQEARAAVQRNGSWGFINPDGEMSIACQYEQVRDFREGRAAVKKQGRWGYIDREGGMVVPCQYDEAGDYQEGYAAVRQGSVWGFVDQKGEMAAACQYDEVKDYSEGLAAVRKQDKWGYIDQNSQEVIAFMYDDAGSFSEGRAPVKRGDYPEEGIDEWAYIDSENVVVIGYYPYCAAGAFRMNVGEFHDGLAFVTDEIPGIIDEKGERVFDSAFFIDDYAYDPKYKAIPAYVFADEAMLQRKYGLAAADGSCLLAPVFDSVETPVDDYVRVAVEVDGKYLYGAIQLDANTADLNNVKGKAAYELGQDKEHEKEHEKELETEQKKFSLEEVDYPSAYDEGIVSDFLSMEPKEFEKKYGKKELYARDILYCGREAWKYDGERVDGFQDDRDCYEVENITAIRFGKAYFTDKDIWEGNTILADEQEPGSVVVRYFGEYALSMYFRGNIEGEGEEAEPELIELSYIKVKLEKTDSRKVAPAALYERLEKSYYEVQEEIRSGKWIVSPDQKKAVCISNGMLPKHPAQIFVRYQEKTPDLIFRKTSECHFVDWIDADHFICYNDAGPVMVHLESGQIENVKKEEDDYDGYGCDYEIQENYLIATCLEEEYYRWKIVREDGEIRMAATDACTELKEMLEAGFFQDITFGKKEKAIVFYEKKIDSPFAGYQILVYKETAGKDILLECVFWIDKKNGDIYRLGEEEHELIGTGAFQGFSLPDEPEIGSVYGKEINDEVVQELLSQVSDFLKTEEGLADFKIMYDGSSVFLGRKYYCVSLIEDNGITVHTLQRYRIDMETGALYEESEHIMTGRRMELYFMGEGFDGKKDEWRTKEYREALQSEALLGWDWVILPGRFEDVQFLGGEYIAVRKENGKYGIMDGLGDFVDAGEYDSVAACGEHIARTCADGTNDHFEEDQYQAAPKYIYEDKARQRKCCGLVGTDGSWLLKPDFTSLEAPYGDYVRVTKKYNDKSVSGVIRLKKKFTEGLSGYRVSELEQFQRIVLYTDTQEDIDKIGLVTSLKQLELHLGYGEGEGVIRNLDAIGELENLKELSIGGLGSGEEVDTTALGNLKKVKKISLWSADMDMSFLSGMEALEDVYTDRCAGMEDLSMLTGLKNLKSISIEYVDAADLNCLKDAERLESIGIQATVDIYGFEALENLHEVQSLYLDGYGDNSERMDLSVLKNMSELESVTIGRISIDGMEYLTGLEHLEWVMLVDTGIEDMEILLDIPNLKDLQIFGNESETVRRQAEEYADTIECLEVSDEIPYGV